MVLPDLKERIDLKIKEIAATADEMPGVIIIHQLPEFKLMYMSKRGLELLGRKWEEIKNMSNEEYHETFFNPEDAQEYVPKILGLLERNTDEVISFFQQVRTSKTQQWDWYMSLIRILIRDEAGKPLLTINTAMKIDSQHYFTAKAARLLEENDFLRKHYLEFASLSEREREILKLLALGKSAVEIAEALHISVATAETHRKNVKRKLNTGNSYNLSQYARAFDLI
jgi:DNA-binding CsgD family transcriptional regulator